MALARQEINTQALIAQVESGIAADIEPLLAALKDLAMGCKVLHVNMVTGEEEVYARAPDRQALIYLIDRVIGKPTEKVEQTHEHILRVTLKHNERELTPPPDYEPTLLTKAHAITADFEEHAYPDNSPASQRVRKKPPTEPVP